MSDPPKSGASRMVPTWISPTQSVGLCGDAPRRANATTSSGRPVRAGASLPDRRSASAMLITRTVRREHPRLDQKRAKRCDPAAANSAIDAVLNRSSRAVMSRVGKVILFERQVMQAGGAVYVDAAEPQRQRLDRPRHAHDTVALAPGRAAKQFRRTANKADQDQGFDHLRLAESQFNGRPRASRNAEYRPQVEQTPEFGSRIWTSMPASHIPGRKS